MWKIEMNESLKEGWLIPNSWEECEGKEEKSLESSIIIII